MSDTSEPFDQQCVNLTQSGLVRSIRVPYISTENLYCNDNIYVRTINDLPVNNIITATNLGTGVGVYAGSTGNSLNFKSLKTTPKLAISDLGTDVQFDANIGSTADTLVSGNDGRLSDSRIVRVKSSNPGAGEYNSVYSAIQYVTAQTRNDTNRWVIFIGPGVYTEPILSIPSYTSIVGANIAQTIIQPDGPHDMFLMQTQCEVSFFTVRNVQTNYSAFVFTDIGDYGQMHKISVLDCWRGAYITSPTTVSKIYLEYVDFSGVLNYGIYANCTQSTTINIENTYVLADTTPPQACMQFLGNVFVTIYTGEIDAATGPGLICGEGTHCDIKSYEFVNCGVAIGDISIGLGADIDVSAVEFDNCSTYVNITNPLSTGSFFSTVDDLSKILIVSASTFYIANQGNQTLTVSQKGGNFTSINAAINYITDATTTKRYIINVAPGIYNETPIVMKQYVSIVGSGLGVTRVNISGTGILFTGAVNTLLSEMNIYGDTTIGTPTVYYTGNAVVGTFTVYKCRFGAGDIICRFIASTGPIQAEIVSCEMLSGAASTTALVINNGATANGCLVDIRSFKTFYPASITNLLDVSGTTTQVSLNTFGVNKINGTGTGINVYNGATAIINNGTITGFNTGISLPLVGAAPTIAINGVLCRSSTTYDLSVLHTGATGSISGTYKQSQTNVDPGVTNVVFNFTNLDTQKGIVAVGKLNLGPTFDTTVNVSDFINDQNVGINSGAMITAGVGLTINVSATTGYVVINPGVSQYLRYISYAGGSLSLSANTAYYIYINSNGVLTSDVSRPSNTTNLTLGRVYTNSSGIEFIDASSMVVSQFGNGLDSMFRSVFGAIYQSGSTVTVNGSLQLTVTSGVYWLSDIIFSPSGISNGNFKQYYQVVGGWNISTVSTVTNTQYNTGGALTAISAGQYVKHSLYTVGAGANEQYLLVIGQGQFASSANALSSANVIPSSFIDGVVPIAEIVVQQGSTTVIINDVRPRPAYAAQLTTNTVVSHSSLSNLNSDDHLQYLPLSGIRAMTGDFNLGTNNITNAGNINGVSITSHASRHLPGGADALSVGVPVNIGTVNSTGIINSFARSDHVHAHGAQTDATLHAVASGVANGFMSSGDKTKLDASTSLATIGALVQRDGSANAAFNQAQVGSMRLTSGAFNTTLQGSSLATADTTITLPSTSGTAGQALTTDGAGVTSWTTINPSNTINRVIYTISSIVATNQNNYIVRLAAPVALSGSATGFTVNPGNSAQSDAIRYTSTISLVRGYISLQFASVNTLSTVTLQLASPGSAGGTRTTACGILANQNGYATNLSVETGGIVANNNVLLTVQWGNAQAVTLLSGYLIAQS